MHWHPWCIIRRVGRVLWALCLSARQARLVRYCSQTLITFLLSLEEAGEIDTSVFTHHGRILKLIAHRIAHWSRSFSLVIALGCKLILMHDGMFHCAAGAAKVAAAGSTST